ncbi:MAG: hypothetical protein ACN6O3_03410 [Comamonas sp.]
MKSILARALCILCCGFFGAGALQAATLYNVTGPDPFGFVNQHVMPMAWSQTNTYTNVTISAPLADFSNGGPIGGTEGTVYLVNQIGPGTTAANNVAPPVTVSGLTASFATRQLWTGLTLPPGTYYVVFASANNDPMSMSPQGSSNPVYTLGTGVTSANISGMSTFDSAFPPASQFGGDGDPFPGNLFLTVTGDAGPVPAKTAAAVPLLGTEGLVALGLLVGLVAVRRMRVRMRS